MGKNNFQRNLSSDQKDLLLLCVFFWGAHKCGKETLWQQNLEENVAIPTEICVYDW